jgi:hypothetical protein
VCKLDNALYGLKQAPQTWYLRLSSKLVQLGFRASKADTSSFVLNQGKLQMYVLIYVDDIIMASTFLGVHHLLAQLWSEFALKDLGPLNYFLAIEVHTCADGIVLTHHRYTEDILHLIGMKDCKSVHTPLVVAEKLSIYNGHLNIDHSTHHLITSLFYILTSQSIMSSELHPSMSFSFTVVSCNHRSAQRRYLR